MILLSFSGQRLIVGVCLPVGGVDAIRPWLSLGKEEITFVGSLEDLRGSKGNIFMDGERYSQT